MQIFVIEAERTLVIKSAVSVKIKKIVKREEENL
jgi:hypothetical protein